MHAQAQAATLRRIGQGGLNEEAALDQAGPAGSGGGGGLSNARRGAPGGENVSTVDVVRHPSEGEQVLRMLPALLRGLRGLPAAAGAPGPFMLLQCMKALLHL